MQGTLADPFKEVILPPDHLAPKDGASQCATSRWGPQEHLMGTNVCLLISHWPSRAFPETCGEASCNWFMDSSLSIVSGHKIYSLIVSKELLGLPGYNSKTPAPPAWPDTLFGESDLILILNLP